MSIMLMDSLDAHIDGVLVVGNQGRVGAIIVRSQQIMAVPVI